MTTAPYELQPASPNWTGSSPERGCQKRRAPDEHKTP